MGWQFACVEKTKSMKMYFIMQTVEHFINCNFNAFLITVLLKVSEKSFDYDLFYFLFIYEVH